MPGRFPILYLTEAGPEAAVLSSGVLDYLVQAMPDAVFTVVGSPESAPLFADTPRLERLLVLERETRLDWIRLWGALRATHWGLIVDMRGTALSGRLRRRKRAVRGAPVPGEHAVQAAARVLQLDDVPPPRLAVSTETLAAADAVVRPDGQPILAIGVGVDWLGKRWPAERYAKVAAALLAGDGPQKSPLAGGRLMLVGAEADRDEAHTVRLAVARSRIIETTGRLTPLQTVAALSRADLYIGGDSLWTQLAVAAGVPTLAVFGPSDEALTGPWGGTSTRGPRSLDEFRALDPHLNQEIQHMMDLPADRVLKAARRMLAERSQKST